jgi:uncharacterized membrane protein
MINSIEQYLSVLKKDLAGCDRATIQDALSDAEEHLSMALNNAVADGATTEAEALAQVIEKYGTPEDIAAAYRNIEHHVTPALSPVTYIDEPEQPQPRDERNFLVRFFGVFAEPRAWGAFLYLLFSLATGIFYFTWVVTGLSLSAGLMVLIIGLPLAGLFILSVRGISLVEGRIVEALLGVRMPRRQVFSQRNASYWLRFKGVISDKQTWLSIIYMLLQMPLGITYFTVLTSLIAVSLYGIASPILQLGFNLPVHSIYGVAYYLPNWFFPISVIGGILLATLTMHLVKHVGRLHGQLAKALLVRF